ncbi:MAG: hypothetical protein HQM10_18010 [Candidatus Riflebacteria bacterium]|nr:hypothetical protein [Candidatus Riflebacteria bacterium]
METRKWPMVLFTLALIGFIYNFLNTVFRSDVKRFSHDRIYVDYSTYQKKDPALPAQPQAIKASGYMPASLQVEIARKTLNDGRMEASLSAYSAHMKNVFSYRPPPPNAEMPVSNPLYEEIMSLARVNLEGLSAAKISFSQGDFQKALTDFLALYQNLPENDLQHRMELSENIAECYFQLANQQAYVDYKLKYIKAARQIRDVNRKAYPNRPQSEFIGVISSQEASQQLLKVRSFAASLPGNRGELLIRRAEYDLALSRSLF